MAIETSQIQSDHRAIQPISVTEESTSSSPQYIQRCVYTNSKLSEFWIKNTSHQQNTFRMKKAKLSKHIANMSLVLFSVADIWSLNKRDSQGDLQWCSVDDSTGEFLSSKAEFKQVLVRTRTVSFQKFLKSLNLLNELSNRKSLLRVKNWQKLFKGLNFEHMKNIPL